MISRSRTLSPCANTPTSPPKHIVTPAASAALNDCRFAAIRAGSGSMPFFQPAYCDDAAACAFGDLDDALQLVDDVAACAFGDLDDALQLVERERRTRFASGTGTIIGVDLDEVSAASHLVARDA